MVVFLWRPVSLFDARSSTVSSASGSARNFFRAVSIVSEADVPPGNIEATVAADCASPPRRRRPSMYCSRPRLVGDTDTNKISHHTARRR